MTASTVRSPEVVVSPPFEAESAPPGGAAHVRQVVTRPDGYFAAVDQGELGGGLYWVSRDTRRAERVDAASSEAVRWIGELEFGTVAVSGLCHGDACVRATQVFVVERTPEQAWRLEPFVSVAGCPASVSIEPGAAALLLGTCGVLYRITARGTEPVARWHAALLPHDLKAAIEGGRTVYYVSFGAVVARFDGASRPTWLAPEACQNAAVGSDGGCACSASP